MGIPAKVLALPALPFLLLSSALVRIAGIAHPMAGEVLGWLAWVPLEYLIRLVHIFSRVPGSDISVSAFSGHLVWAYYGVFAVVLLLLTGRAAPLRWLSSLLPRGREPVPPGTDASTRLDFSLKLYLTLGVGLAVVASILWFYVVTDPDGRLYVYFLDVGQGDSVLIVTPEGSNVLVDGGPGELGAAQGVGRNIPFVDRKLDLVVLQRYEVGTVLEGGGVSDNPLYLELEKAFERMGEYRVTAFEGQTIVLDRTTWLEVLSPFPDPIRGSGSDTNNGVVLRLVHGGVSFLLTAAIEAEAERRLLQDGEFLESTVLKVGHHGSKTSTTRPFLSRVSPAAAVISAGAKNPYGHPHREVTDRLDAALGAEKTYQTAQRGDIELISDGSRLWVKTAR